MPAAYMGTVGAGSKRDPLLIRGGKGGVRYLLGEKEIINVRN